MPENLMKARPLYLCSTKFSGPVFCVTCGCTESVGPENGGPENRGPIIFTCQKVENAGPIIPACQKVENAEPENARPNLG